ncbi:transcription factor bHLH101-like isoform X2 [Asparagus officinalis]|uniref:transcription factor bHLH101-like isoform X2 n=1 Tax=Asparagus officinalis TaxID=4686 RepID=UPI00098E4534|nr:transcription factor bHLH101-like isoform X2 [Asparagus officinalis]
MLPLSPTTFPTFDWQLDQEHMIHEIPLQDLFASYNLNEGDISHNSSISSPHLPDFEYEDIEDSIIKTSKLSNSMKKSTHNEYERDRRKKLNKLYSSLRELLPEKDQRKLSIPCTIAHVLEYIPKLQKHIKRLQRKKEELLSRVPSNDYSSICNKERMINPVISAVFLSKKEIMIQICILNKQSAATPFSKVVNILEREGFRLLNATTLTTHDDKTIYSLHLQAKEAMRMENQNFFEQLVNFLNE